MADRYFEVNKINVRYGDIQVLWDIEFTADKGEIVALVGSNGAGKSTTVKSCAGLIRPFQGNIRLDGHDLTGAACRTFIDHGVILVPEGRQLFPSMTIYENLEMGASSKAAKAAKKDTIERIYNWFPKLKDRKNQLAGTLSGGEQQMLAIGRALMAKPRVLLLDEPSLGLAPIIINEIFKELTEVNRQLGMTILIVEQNARKALQLSHRAYVIQTGKIMMEGKSDDLLHNPEIEEAYLGGKKK